MNTTPSLAGRRNEITNEFTSATGFATIGTDMIQDMYTDFGWGGDSWHPAVGRRTAGVTANSSAYANLTKDGGYLTGGIDRRDIQNLERRQRIPRKTKAYRWIIDNQLAVVMPLAKADSEQQQQHQLQLLGQIPRLRNPKHVGQRARNAAAESRQRSYHRL